MKTILIVATLDTKGAEVSFAREQIESLGAKAMLLDAGVLNPPMIAPCITREEVADAACSSIEEIRNIGSEGAALDVMAVGGGNIALRLYQEGKIHGVLSIGGSCGTSLGTGVMRALPIGVPKFMISSQAANPAVVGATVKTSDICMFHSVSDVAGLNRLTKTIFARACGGVVGMARAEIPQEKGEQKTIGFCSKGTTEAANVMIRQRIFEAGYQPMTFHCFGFGPASFEQVIKDGFIEGGVIELASDWIDRIGGGNSFPPDDRYENAGKLGLPQVFVPGSCDFIASDRASAAKYPGRINTQHNAAVQLYRTTREELIQAGREIGEKLSRSRGPVTVVIPMRGFCVHDCEGGVLYNPDADAGFVEAISAFDGRGMVKIKKIDAHINDGKFVDAIMDAFMENVAEAEEKKTSLIQQTATAGNN